MNCFTLIGAKRTKSMIAGAENRRERLVDTSKNH